MKNIPDEIIEIIFDYASIKCKMCDKCLNIRSFFKWNLKYYGHKRCIENLELLML